MWCCVHQIFNSELWVNYRISRRALSSWRRIRKALKKPRPVSRRGNNVFVEATLSELDALSFLCILPENTSESATELKALWKKILNFPHISNQIIRAIWIYITSGKLWAALVIPTVDRQVPFSSDHASEEGIWIWHSNPWNRWHEVCVLYCPALKSSKNYLLLWKTTQKLSNAWKHAVKN